MKLTIDKRKPDREPTETDDLKVVSIRSRLLSAFHKRDVKLEAVVGLPDAYAKDAERRFPTLYVIPGFGGGLSSGSRMVSPKPYQEAGIDLVVVYLNPDCPTGHHVFADSANNGPVGQALIEELIPHLEKEFRLIADTDARYVTGHSSGGWSSLWLQVTYPDTFGGVWSTSPDPVDFSAFQTSNIYDSSDNFFTMPDGSPRPIARGRGRGGIACKDFSDMEVVLGRGGQLQSFEAVFSPRGPDGKPRPLWDRKTGRLDPVTAEAWKKYDIRLILEKDWKTLGPKLRGKLHLFCGDEDTFYLDRAFVKLRAALGELGSDAYIEYRTGEHHGLSIEVFRKTIPEQIARQFRERYEAKRR
jgi:S-formylglutathione hydrolase FrmB